MSPFLQWPVSGCWLMTTSQSTSYSVPRRLRRREQRNKGQRKERRKEEGEKREWKRRKRTLEKEQQTSGDGKRQHDRVSQLSKQRNTNNTENNKMDLPFTPNPI